MNNKGQNNEKNMNERKKRILWAIVQDYADTAEPVGSRTVAKKYDLGVSSATIRNDMQDLEDEGYLEQPHTSAGRIPSIKGYRFYVDKLMMPHPVTEEEEAALYSVFKSSSKRVDEIFCNMAKIIASLTHTLSLSASAKGSCGKFNYVRFLPLDGTRAILLAVTDSGEVTNVVVRIPEGTTLEELQLLADKLNRFLHGKELRELDENIIMKFQKEISKNISPYMHVFKALNQAMIPRREVYSGGASALIEQPEFRDIERVQDLLNLLEKRELLHSLLMETMDEPISVDIGTENTVKSFSDLSVIRAQFKFDNQVLGSIAVLGPTRMQYGKIVGMLHFMQKRLSELLKGDV